MANRRFIDFPIAASVGNNDIVLIWQDGLNKQTTKATLLQGSPQSLAGLTDVDISALTNGQILQYNSTLGKWENVDRTDINLSELGDVTIVAPANGQVLVYNSSTGKWENSSGGYVPYTGAVTTVNLGAQSILAGSFVKAGGTSAQFLKANGSVDSTAYGTGSVTSVALTMPTAFSVAGSPITTAGTLAVTGAGTVGQYIRGDGSLADFPATTGGGSSVSYYLNGSVSQGTIGGVAYRELNRTPIFGAGTDISINADGYIASFITDALDPNKLLIPAGNWNFETYFSASSSGGSPSFYVELYKYNGTTFTLIATSSSAPELIAFGTNLNPYYSTLAVPETVLALTDRLAVRFYVTHSGRTITLHTENGHLCQVITTFTTGLTALNGLTSQVQFFAVGTSGTDFAISSASDTHTFNLPTASASNRGALSSADWTTFNGKENAIIAGTTAQYFRGDKTFHTLNTSVVPEGTNLYYTEARVNANTNVAANTAARHNAVTLGTANGLSLSTQVLSLGLASAGVTGALSGTDWTTFNGKQNALTNPVTGTGTTNYLPKFTGSTTIGNSNIQDSGTLVSVGVAATFSTSASINTTNAYGKFQTKVATDANFYLTSYNAGEVAVQFTNDANSLQCKAQFYASQFAFTTGNLLVGTTTDAGFKLDVNGTGRFINSVLGGTGSAFADGLRVNRNSNTNQYTVINHLGGATNIVSVDQSGNNIAEIYFGRSINGSTITNSMVIDKSGNVGIGTANATGQSADNRVIQIYGAGVGNRAQIHFVNSDSGESTTDGSFIGIDFSRELYIINRENAATIFENNGSERMRITSGGNVLIGTTTDVGAKLTVNGVVSSLGNAFLSNSGNLTMTGTYQTIFTAGTDSAYFLTVQTNSNDGTYAIFTLFNENSGERIVSTILGNNIQVQFSGNDVQIRSANGVSYTVTYGTIRIK
jgi:hypothetical protein